MERKWIFGNAELHSSKRFLASLIFCVGLSCGISEVSAQEEDVENLQVDLNTHASSESLLNSDQVFLPQSMAALGDSISAGLFANFSRKNANLPWIETWFVLRSLSAATIWQLKGLEKKDFAWSAGYNTHGKVLTHARRLAALDPSRSLKVMNVAHSGDTVLDILSEQLPKLNAASQKNLGQAYPDYVTILVGANDICAKDMTDTTSVQDFHDRLDKVVSEILEKSPRTKVMLSSLPNIDRLRKVAWGARLWGWGALKKCEDVWNLVKLCPTLTTIEDPIVRDAVKQRVDDFNLVARDVADRHNQDHAGRIRFTEETFKVAFTADHLSMDCFHPNPSGQNELSRATFSSSWWPTDGKFDSELLAKMHLKTKCDSEHSREAAGSASRSNSYRMSSECWKYFYRTPDEDKNIGSIKYYKD